ncbi:MAG: hypothetical protein JWQ49_4866 [Edaphobacter sp.]|nr:hypothetical protein [Edaphobacter sp.]
MICVEGEDRAPPQKQESAIRVPERGAGAKVLHDTSTEPCGLHW